MVPEVNEDFAGVRSRTEAPVDDGPEPASGPVLPPVLTGDCSLLAQVHAVFGGVASLLIQLPTGDTAVHTRGPDEVYADGLRASLSGGSASQALRLQHAVLVADTAAEERWQGWGLALARQGWGSALSVPLGCGSHCEGALTLLAALPGTFSHKDVALAQVMATSSTRSNDCP